MILNYIFFFLISKTIIQLPVAECHVALGACTITLRAIQKQQQLLGQNSDIKQRHLNNSCMSKPRLHHSKEKHAISHGRIFEDFFCKFVYLFQTKIVCLQWASKFHELAGEKRYRQDSFSTLQCKKNSFEMLIYLRQTGRVSG